MHTLHATRHPSYLPHFYYQGHRAEAEWKCPLGVSQVCRIQILQLYEAKAHTKGGQSKFVAIVRRTVETNSATLVCQIIGIILIARNAGGLWFSEAGELPSNRGLSSDFIVKVLIDKVTTKLYLFALIGSCQILFPVSGRAFL